MDTEGSHSGDRNGCGDGKQWRRGKGIVGERKRCRGEGMTSGRDGGRVEAMPREAVAVSGRDAEGRDGGRAERAACRRYAIVVSPTQVVPEVLAVWGSD